MSPAAARVDRAAVLPLAHRGGPQGSVPASGMYDNTILSAQVSISSTCSSCSGVSLWC
jgi:hypothetical protein